MDFYFLRIDRGDLAHLDVGRDPNWVPISRRDDRDRVCFQRDDGLDVSFLTQSLCIQSIQKRIQGRVWGQFVDVSTVDHRWTVFGRRLHVRLKIVRNSERNPYHQSADFASDARAAASQRNHRCFDVLSERGLRWDARAF